MNEIAVGRSRMEEVESLLRTLECEIERLAEGREITEMWERIDELVSLELEKAALASP